MARCNLEVADTRAVAIEGRLRPAVAGLRRAEGGKVIYPMGFYLIVGMAIVFGIWRMTKKNIAGCNFKITMMVWVAILLVVADWALKITQWLVRPFFAELVMVGISLAVFFVLALTVWFLIWLATRRFNRWWDANAGMHL